MTGVIVLCILSIAALYNWRDNQRLIAIAVVSCVTIAEYAVYYLLPYAAIVETTGYYEEQTVWSLAVISILYLVRGKLAFCLMALHLAHMAILATYFTYESMAIEPWPPFLHLQWLIFAVQMALLFSRRFTDATCRYLTESRLGRDFSYRFFNSDLIDDRRQFGSKESET